MWVVPVFGLGLVGAGVNTCFLPISTYLVEAYAEYTASAMAAKLAWEHRRRRLTAVHVSQTGRWLECQPFELCFAGAHSTSTCILCL
jgi:hypothetical protein